ncbi:MAG TPA: sodium-dependent transporter [Longimicrobiales bacterium]
MAKGANQFSNRWVMLAAMMGMAVGTGNIWRFPRIAATNGGGSFLIAWAFFLLVWAIPLILVEFTVGKETRSGPIGAFVRLVGRRYAWMGAFIAWTTIAIMCYYSVVTGWSVRYLIASLTGELSGAEPGALWNSFAFGPGVLWVHALSMAAAVFIVAKGVKGIEAANKVMIPSLFVLLIILAIRAVTLPGGTRGLEFLFGANLADLANHEIWLAALTQNAWSTGAGWGLITVYAIYMREHEDTVLNSFALGLGNNLAGLIAGIMVLCTVFSILPNAADQIVGAGNTGLTFIWVPQLFNAMPAGGFFMVLFFIALVFAALTSLIAMAELAVRVLTDVGMPRGRALAIVGIGGFAIGVPSALNENVFLNQDFIWGVALLLSGIFFAFAVLKYGVRRFREGLVNTSDADLRMGRWWDWAIRLSIVEAAALVVWWFWQEGGIQQALDGDWGALFGTFGLGWAVVQWGVAVAVFLALNEWLARRVTAGAPAAAEREAREEAPAPAS